MPPEQEFIDRHWQLTHRLARYRQSTGDRSDPASVTSDALLGLIRAARTWDPQGGRAEDSWVRYCVEHAMTDGYRARHGDPRNGRQARPTTQPWDEHPRLVHIDDLDAVHTRVDIHRALQALDDRTRAAVEAYYWDGWTLTQVGTLLDVGESGASLALKRARARMRRALAGH